MSDASLFRLELSKTRILLTRKELSQNAKSLQLMEALTRSCKLLILSGGARDGIEPPQAFSGALPMDLSGLKSADRLKRKLLVPCRFRIVWDHLGWFPPQVVPELFPASKPTNFTSHANTFSLHAINVRPAQLWYVRVTDSLRSSSIATLPTNGSRVTQRIVRSDGRHATFA
jgi:hypothetical protein